MVLDLFIDAAVEAGEIRRSPPYGDQWFRDPTWCGWAGKTMLRCDTMSSSQEPLVLFGRDDGCARCCHHLFQKMTFVCRQRSMRRSAPKPISYDALSE